MDKLLQIGWSTTRNSLVRYTFTLLALLLMASAGHAQETTTNVVYGTDPALIYSIVPTVTSDKDDYAPGETAIITGSGWTKDQYVDIHLEEEPVHDHHHGYHDTKVNSDGTWEIRYPIEERHLGVKFTVIVDGKQTGYQSLAYFTDGKITFRTVGLPVNTEVIVTYNYNGQGNNNGSGSILITTPNTSVYTVNNANFTYTFPTSVEGSDGLNYILSSTPTGSITDTGSGNLDFVITGNYVKSCTSPLIVVSDISTIKNSSGTCSAFVTMGGNITVTAGSPIPTITYSLTNGGTTISNPNTFPVGTTTVYAKATNSCGNTVQSFTVTVVDETNPTITAPAAVRVAANASCAASGVVLGDATAADNCSVASVTNNAPASFPLGATIVTWTVTDGAGLTATATQTVTVVDETNPTITAPAAVRVAANASCAASGVVLGDATAADNCSVASVTNNAPASFPLGATIVTWTVTDGAGLTATATQTVTVVDETNPTITAPAAVRVAANASCAASGVVLGDATAADNCSVASVTNNAPASFPLGATIVTWTVTDGAGLTATATQTVTVVDETNPTITAPAAVRVAANASCAASGVVLGDATAADNCSVASVTNNAPASFPLGATIVTWTVTDGAGLTATATQTVTVVDETNPTITAPAAVRVAANASCAASGVVLGDATAADNCSVASVTNNAPASFPLGATIVTWTVTDGAGLTATATQTVTVVDETNPTITAPAAVRVAANASCAASGVVLGDATAADNCSVASVTNNAPASFPLGATIVTWTVTDGAGLTATATQTVTVVDETNPTITAPAAVRVAANASCAASGVVLGDATAADNCSVASVTNNAPASFPLGATIVTWTVTDGAGLTATATQTVTVVDETNPTITAPAAVRVAANASCAASGVVLGDATAADNCSVASVTNNAPASFPLGATIVTWTVTDGAGLTATATQTVTVVDETNPTITAPAAVRVAANASCAASGVVLGDATAADNCSVASVTNNAPASFPLGATIVTWTVTDGAGLTATATQTVTVVDETNPTITAPAAVRVAANASCAASGVVLGDATAADNCSVASVTNNAPASFPLGATIVTWTVTDGAGLTATATQTVTVVDETNPTITAPAAVRVAANASCAASGVVLGDATAADNCSVASVTNNAPASFPLGATIVTWTVTDGAGLTATATQTVTVVDETNPTIITQASSLQLESDGSGNTAALNTWLASRGGAFSSDNCSTITWTHNFTAISDGCGETGSAEVTFTATDASGNTSTTTATITIIDSNVPVLGTIQAPAAPVQVGQNFNLSATVNDVSSVSATWYFSKDGDFTNADLADFTILGTVTNGKVLNTFNSNQFISAGNSKGAGVYSVKLVVIDACGNESVTTFNFVVLYDPEGGFVTGGGWIYSRPGSMPNNPLAAGTANFGFNAKYKTGKTNVNEVDGSTNFQFREGDFHFRSSYHADMSLVISGAKATYRGEGSVNGIGGYSFMVTVIDGDVSGGGGVDRFRIKVWPTGSPSIVTYDNELGMAENADAATALGSGSIVIHKPTTKGGTTTTATTKRVIDEPATVSEIGTVTAYPNPLKQQLFVELPEMEEQQVALTIYTLDGRVMTQKKVQTSGPAMRVKLEESFDLWSAGIYLLKVEAKGQQKVIRLMK